MKVIYWKFLPVIFSLILISTSLCVQAQDDKKANEEILTNESIITLAKAGLSASVIINKIRSSKTKFDVSTAELLRLKKENIADEIVNAMIEASQTEATKSRQTADTSLNIDPNDPASPHEAGVYLMKDNEGHRQMIKLDPSIYTQAKSGGFFKSAMTYGIAKVKSKAVLAGRNAKFQVDNARPVFYFYFETTNAGLSNSGNVLQSSSTTPNEFVLVKMDMKKNGRELVVGQFNAFGAQSGTLDEYVQEFDYERIAPGVFKVTLKRNLAEGEYGFFYGGTTPLATYGYFGPYGGPKIFDFGIKVVRLP